MTQASVNIMQQYKDGGVVPANLTGQNAVSKKYVDDQLEIRDVNIATVGGAANAAATAASNAQADIDAHEASTIAHPAQNITYSGPVLGAINVKQAIDKTDERISNIVAQSGNDNTEIVDARGGYPILGARLDSSDEQLSDIAINVKKYGAVGDGVADDTIPIQEAIDFASTKQATVYFPSGKYRVTTSLIASNGFFRLQGAGGYNRQSTILMDDQSSGDVLTVTADYFVRVEDLRLQHLGSSGMCVNFNNGESHSLVNCSLQNATGNTSDMIYFSGSSIRIEGNRIDNYEPLAYAIKSDKVLNRININSNITNNKIGGLGKGILVSSTDPNGRPEGLLIYGNHIILPSNEHLTIKSSFYINISNNVFDQCTGNAISILPDIGTNNAIFINNNWFSGVGFAIYKPASDLGVKYLNISNNMFHGWNRAVYIDLSTQTNEVISIYNNQVDMCELAFAIIFAKDVSIIGNTLTSCTQCLDVRDGTNGGPFIIKDNYLTGTAVISDTSRSKFILKDNYGFKTNGFTSAVYAPTTTGVKYLTIPHGLSLVPHPAKTILTLDNVGNDDFDVSGLSVISMDATNIGVRLRVNIASGVADRVAKVNVYAEF